MTHPAADTRFSSDLWQAALEKYAIATHLTMRLFDADERVVFGPIHPTPVFRLFEEIGYDPGMFAECARRCIAQIDTRPAVLVMQAHGLAVVGASLMLDGKIVGAAVGGYAFADFSQASEIHRLARQAGIAFERLWAVVRKQPPVPQQRLVVHGELLQVLGDALLRENHRTRQYEQAVERLVRLQTATAAFSGALTPQDVAQVALTEGIGALNAQAGAVYVLGTDGTSLEMLRHVGYPDEFARQRRAMPLDAGLPVAVAVKTRDAIYCESADHLLGRYPALREQMHPSPGARVYVPIMVSGRPIGALELIFHAPRSFAPIDCEFIQALAQQCAQALERAGLYAHERRIAATLQRALLPSELPALPGIDISVRYVPATAGMNVGGDWYDAFLLPDGRLAVSVGDVVGHGLASAALMGQLRQALRVGGQDTLSPGAALAVADRALRTGAAEAQMATAVFGILDPASLEFVYASAGHPTPILAAGGHAESLPGSGLPLGYGKGAWPEHRVTVPAGSRLALYTDGLVENERDLTAGTIALLTVMSDQAATCAAEPAAGVLARVLDGRDPRDDVALMVLAVDPVPHRLEVTLPATPPSLQLIRQAFRRTAPHLGLTDEQCTVLQVALGELVTNVVEHAYAIKPGTVTVRVRGTAQAITMEVEDQGRWRPPRSEGRGFGLQIARMLTGSLDIHTRSGGTCAILTVPLPLSPGTASIETPLAPGAAGDVEMPTGQREAWSVETTQSDTGPFEIRRGDGMPVVRVHAVLDRTTAEAFEAALTTAACADRGGVTVVLDDASYFDSQAIEVVFRCHAALARHRQALRLVIAARHPLRRILEAGGVPAVVGVFETLEHASAKTAVPATPVQLDA